MLPDNLTCVTRGAVIQARILFVEDSQDDVELLLACLRSSDLAPEWLRVASESELREALASSEWQVALVDYDLPGFSGLEALHILAHAAPDLPAITVSGTISEETAAATISAGAVDFVLKDNLTRLAPAVRRAMESAALRRAQRDALEQAQQSQFAVDHASQAIVYVSEAGVVLYANGAAGRLAGIAPEAAIGEEIWAWYPQLSREDWPGLWHAATEGPVEDVDALLRRADGSERAVSITLDHMVRDESEFVIAYARDLTESKRAQADLSFTQFVVEHAGDSVFWMEAEGAFKYANPAACEALGYTLDELRMMSIRDIDPKYSSRWAEHISELKEAGSLTFETHHRRRDGTLVPVEVTAVYLEYDGVAYDVGFARDITERKRADEALAASEKRFRGYFEQSLIGAAVTSPGKGFVDINQTFLELIGYTREELADKSWAELTHPDDVAADVAQFERVMAGETDGYRLEKRFIRKDGEAVHVDLSVRVVRDDRGAVEYFLALVTDVTERRRAEKALHESEERFRLLSTSTPDSTSVQDRDLRYEWVVNPALGLTAGEFIGRTDADLVDAEQYEMVRALKQQVIDTGEALHVEVPLTDAQGKTTYYNGTYVPRRDADANVTGVLSYFQDVTERRQVAAELERERRDYETIFDSSPVMIVYKSADDHILKVNDAFARFIGLPKDEIVGMTTFDVADPKETARLGRDDDLEVIRTGEPRMNALVFFSSPFSESAAWVLFSKLPFRDDSGDIAGTVSFVTDVTDRKLAEDALESSAAQLRRTVEGSVLAMGQVVETRDPYTAGHERRVSELAVAIAAEMAIGAADLDGLRMAALIHDVGKVAVPAEILSKPGRLSEVEFSLIKQHAQAGYDILRAIEFQQPVAEMVLQHHERLDGSGYPGGLLGEDTLLESRILAVADVVEAMSSHRPYRPALGMEVALGEIRENAGMKYDAEVAAACLRVVEEQGFAFTG